MLVSENRPEWCLADLAIMAAGGVTVPTYTTNTERDHSHILGLMPVVYGTEEQSSGICRAWATDRSARASA